MNCERAETYLSAFLDNALDPRLSHEVRAHLEDCVHCRAILDDYRSFDHLLASAARVEPSDALGERLFTSDEFRRIQAAHAAGTDLSNEPEVLAALRSPDLGSPDLGSPDLGSDPAGELDELRLPDVGETPELAGEAADAGGAPPGVGLLARVRSTVTSAAWSKALLPVAAALTLSFGAALLMRQGLFPFSTHNTPGLSTTLGNPGQQGIPLAAGPRVIYLHDGILWSAPENGPGIAQPLTPSGRGGVTVGAWSVSPSSHLVAYLDRNTGTLHVVRSDGLSDRVIATSVAGGIVWSPDGAHLAYLAVSSGGNRTLHIVDSAGGNDYTLSPDGASAANAVWSGDSQWLAYTLSHDGAVAVWAYDRANNLSHQFAAPADAGTGVAQLTWLGDPHHPALTWATTDSSGALTGIASASAEDSSPHLLTPTGAHYTAAAYTSSVSGGAWLLGDRNSLTLLTLADGSRTTAAVLDAPVGRIVWSSAGVAAVTDGQSLALWSPATGLVAVDTNVAAGIVPIWSTDGHSLVYVTSGGVQVAQVSGAHVSTTTALQAADVSALSLAPDDHSLAVVTSAGVVLIAPDGSHAKLVDHHTPDAGAVAWSVAG